MAAPTPGPEEPQPAALNFDSSDIGHSGPFMESLVDFLNQASICITEAKQRAGMAVGCASPMNMNEEEKQEKLNCILSTLVQKCNLEISSSASSYRTAPDSSGRSFATASEGMRSPSSSTACPCPPSSSMRSLPSTQMPRGRRADTPRPGTTPVRGRVATPDDYFIPVNQSSMNSSPSGVSQQGGLCPTYARSGQRGRTNSPYSTMVDSSGSPGAYRSGPGAFDDLSSSQSGRGNSSYPSSSFGSSGCPPECATSINSTGRQDYRRLRGPVDEGVFREANRTV